MILLRFPETQNYDRNEMKISIMEFWTKRHTRTTVQSHVYKKAL